MDSRERSNRDFGLGFSSNQNILARMRTAALAQQVTPPMPKPRRTATADSESPSTPVFSEQKAVTLPNWIKARASADISLYPTAAAQGEASHLVAAGEPIRILLPVQKDADGAQWAQVQVISDNLGSLLTGFGCLANDKSYSIADIEL